MHRSVGLFALLALALVACDDKSASKSPNTDTANAPQEGTSPAPSASASAAEAKRPPREPHPQGPSLPLFTAVRNVEASDEVKAKISAAEKVAAGAQDDSTQTEQAREAAKKLYTELSAQVKAGKIEAAKLTPLYTAIEEVTKARLEAEAEGLNQLHAALTPELRQSVVGDLRKREQQREEHLAAAQGADGGARKPSNRSDVHHIDRLTKELELDDAQKTSVGAFAVKDDSKESALASKRKKATEALYAAFEKDTFDAKKLDLFAPKTLSEGFEEEGKFLAKLVPVLKPEQREKLAGKVEKGWPLYDRANPYLRNRLLGGLPGRLTPGGLPGKGSPLKPVKPNGPQTPPPAPPAP